MAIVLLGSKAVGSVVTLKESGSPVNYIVVHQGLPSSIYDSTCDGTWLVREKCLAESMVWDESYINKYEESDIHIWLNSNMLLKYDTEIQEAIKQVRIPYRKNGGLSGTNQSGSDGLLTKVFLLSTGEVGWNMGSHNPNDGSKLTYFESGDNESANAKRAAKIESTNGIARYSLRSPDTSNDAHIWYVDYYGDCVYTTSSIPFAIRPVLILPATAYVSDDGEVFANQPPTAPESITIPDIAPGMQAAITWGAASDPDGTIASYTLERSINDSGWVQIFSGNALTYTDTVGDWGTVAYRVCAVDNKGKSGDYKTSEKTIVKDGVFYISGPAPDMGEKAAPFDFTITAGISGDAQAVSGVTCTILLDGYTLHTDSTSTGEDTTVNIDVRTISGGAHTITAKADKEDYVSAVEQYTFTTPEIPFPPGGKAEQLQDQTGKPIFPQTTAALVQGIAGKSLAGNLEELYSGLVYGEGLDTLLLSVLEG